MQPLHYLHGKDLKEYEPNHSLVTDYEFHHYLQVYYLGMFHIIYDFRINSSLVCFFMEEFMQNTV